MTTQASGKNLLLGILYASLTCLFFSFLDTIAKVLAVSYAVILIVWLRFLVHSLLVVAVSLRRRQWQHWRSNSYYYQLIRSALVMMVTVCNFVALQYLPLATTATIFFLSPLIACGLAPIILKEHVGIRRWLAVIVGFIGVVIVINPGGADFHWSLLVAVGAAVFYAFYFLITRKSSQIDSIYTNFIYTPLAGTLFLAPLALTQLQLPTSATDFALILGMGLFGGIGHLFLIYSVERTDASYIAPFQYQQIFYMALLGWLIFGDIPTGKLYIGATLVIISGLYVWYRENLILKKKNRDALKIN